MTATERFESARVQNACEKLLYIPFELTSYCDFILMNTLCSPKLSISCGLSETSAKQEQGQVINYKPVTTPGIDG